MWGRRIIIGIPILLITNMFEDRGGRYSRGLRGGGAVHVQIVTKHTVKE